MDMFNFAKKIAEPLKKKKLEIKNLLSMIGTG